MSKEQVLKNFDTEFGTFKFHDNDCVEHDDYDIRHFLSKAIDQTREETIMEVDEMLPEILEIKVDNFGVEYPYNKERNATIREIKQSLINLRQK